MRKFFNCYLRIPPFINTELSHYTYDLLKSTGIEEFDDQTAYVISSAYRHNPRQIKQFINTLIAHIELARVRESEKLINREGTITSHPAFLAKLLVIEQKFPNVYSKIANDHLSIQEIESESFLSEQKAMLGFEDFIKSTHYVVRPSDIRPFIYLKQSEGELSISGLDELELALKKNDTAFVTSFIGQLKKDNIKLQLLEQHIEGILRKTRNKIEILNSITCALSSMKSNGLRFRSNFYNAISNILTENPPLSTYVPQLNPSLIFDELLPNTSDDKKIAIINQYVYLFQFWGNGSVVPQVSDEYIQNLFSEFISRFEVLTTRNKTDIQSTLEQRFSTNTKILDLFKDKSNIQQELLSVEAINRFVGSINTPDIDNQAYSQKISTLIALAPVVTSQHLAIFMEKNIQLIKNENGNPYREQKELFLKELYRSLLSFKPLLQNLDRNLFFQLYELLHTGSEKTGNIGQKNMFMPLILFMRNFLDDPRKTNQETALRTMLVASDANNLQSLFSILNNEDTQYVMKSYEKIFREKISNDNSYFKLLYPLSQGEIRTSWTVMMVNSPHYKWVIPYLESEKIYSEQYKPVLAALVPKIEQVGAFDKAELHQIIINWKCGESSEQMNAIQNQIIILLKSENKELQACAVALYESAVYLSATAKREILINVSEWLYKQEKAKAHQPVLVRFLLKNLSEIPEIYLKFLIETAFHKLVIPASNIDAVSTGLEILSSTQPSYLAYKNGYEDVYQNLLSKQFTPEISGKIILGLKEIRSKEGENDERAYWKKIEDFDLNA